MKKIIKIAFIGQPNVGKSLLINSLAHADMKVGNFSGVTVEKAQAKMMHKGYELEIIDLPGTYSLDGYSHEEMLSKNYINSGEYDILVDVCDSTNIERNLLLTAQLLERDKKMIIALNMSDEAKNEGIQIDAKKMSELLSLPCIKVSAKTKENLSLLLDEVISLFQSDKNLENSQQWANTENSNSKNMAQEISAQSPKNSKNSTPKIPTNKRIFSDGIEMEIIKLSKFLAQKDDPNANALKLSYRELAIALIKGENEIYKKLHDKAIWLELSPRLTAISNRLYAQFDTKSIKEIFAQDLAAFASGVAAECVSYKSDERLPLTHKIDKVLIHRFFGLPIFLFFMWAIFQLTFSLGEIPMGWIEDAFGALGDAIKSLIDEEKNPQLCSLIVDGALGGVGAVLSFLPNIVILFFGISLLETTGYMARVAYLLDGFFHRFGLHGKSFIPLVTGFGCSVPAFMAARTLKNRKDRLLTLFITPFAQCGAKLPVFVLFCSAFAPENQAGNWLFGIYIFSAIIGLICAKILRKIAFKGPDEPFVMELPKYRMPNWNLVWFSIYHKAKMYMKKAGTYILAASVLIWWAQTYPYNEEMRTQFDTKIELSKDEGEKTQLLITKQNYLLENSYLGSVGRAISPIFAPLGFGWQESVSILTGLAAKEVVIATMGVLYSVGIDENEESAVLSDKLKEAMSPKTALAFVLFTMFYNPCLAATMVFRRESGAWKYTGALFIFTFIVAYICALGGILVYNLL